MQNSDTISSVVAAVIVMVDVLLIAVVDEVFIPVVVIFLAVCVKNMQYAIPWHNHLHIEQ